MKHTITALLTALLTASVALADVTVNSQTSGTGMGTLGEGESVVRVKGLKMRSEQRTGKNRFVMIMDVEKRQMISLDEKKKQAEVFDLTELAKEQAAITGSDVVAELKAGGGSREIAGYACKEHQMTIRVRSEPMPGESLDIVMSGPVWLSEDAPGHEEYARFYLAAAEAGMFFGQPAAAKGQPGQARGMTLMYKTMAEAGMPLASEIKASFDGTGMMGSMMKKMGFTMSTTVTSISTEPLPDDLFAVPAGWKTKSK
jgi:hypothetical protein